MVSLRLLRRVCYPLTPPPGVSLRNGNGSLRVGGSFVGGSLLGGSLDGGSLDGGSLDGLSGRSLSCLIFKLSLMFGSFPSVKMI
jgi:hypothetical protein